MSNSEELKSKEKTSTPKVVVKTEGVQRPAAYERLASFRQPRDLTLGGSSSPRAGVPGLNTNKNRRNYAPNLNVQRNKNKEVVVKEDIAKPKKSERGRKTPVKSERGRGRAANVIQSTGVFSEGIAEASKSGRSRPNTSDSGSSYIPKPKLDLKKAISFDSKEEGDRLKMLLNDSFIDDPDSIKGSGVKPLQLPMIPQKKCGKALIKKEDPDMKPLPSSGEGNLPIKMKEEPIDDADLKPAIDQDPEFLFDRCIKDVMTSKNMEFVLFQFPDCLPGLSGAESDLPSSSSSALNTPEDSSKSKCTLDGLPEGLLGKIQLFKSGKALLNLGTSSLPVSMGTQVSFRQDLISVKLSDLQKNGSMINLGQIRSRLVVTPDWEAMLDSA